MFRYIVRDRGRQVVSMDQQRQMLFNQMSWTCDELSSHYVWIKHGCRRLQMTAWLHMVNNFLNFKQVRPSIKTSLALPIEPCHEVPMNSSSSSSSWSLCPLFHASMDWDYKISFCPAVVCLSIGVSVYPWDFSAMFLIAKKYDGPNAFADATHNLALALYLWWMDDNKFNEIYLISKKKWIYNFY